MNVEEIFDRVNAVFQRVFHNPSIQVNRETTAKDIQGWDSITHLDIITGMEEEFKVEISGFEVMNLQNVGDLIDLLSEKLGA